MSEGQADEHQRADEPTYVDLTGRMTPHLAADDLFDAVNDSYRYDAITLIAKDGKWIAAVTPVHAVLPVHVPNMGAHP